MPPDDHLVQRVRAVLAERPGLSERPMMGARAFMLHGNMACAVRGDDLMVRLEREEVQEALADPHVSPHPLKTFVVVDALALQSEEELADWVDAGANLASSLPPK